MRLYVLNAPLLEKFICACVNQLKKVLPVMGLIKVLSLKKDNNFKKKDLDNFFISIY